MCNLHLEYAAVVTVEVHSALCNRFHDFIDTFVMFYKGFQSPASTTHIRLSSFFLRKSLWSRGHRETTNINLTIQSSKAKPIYFLLSKS